MTVYVQSSSSAVLNDGVNSGVNQLEGNSIGGIARLKHLSGKCETELYFTGVKLKIQMISEKNHLTLLSVFSLGVVGKRTILL